MKPIGSIAEKRALRQALDQMEATRNRPKGKTPGGAQDAQGALVIVRSLERVRAAQKAVEASQLEALARKAGMDPEAAARLADSLRAQVSQDWTFIMLSASQNAAVVRWLLDNSQRPHAAAKLWARLFELIRSDTGEVMASRSELATHLGIEPRHLSELMTELAAINAIRRERSGRGVKYFMNSNVATHLPGAAARKSAQEADGPLMVLMQGGKSDVPG